MFFVSFDVRNTDYVTEMIAFNIRPCIEFEEFGRPFGSLATPIFTFLIVSPSYLFPPSMSHE